MARVATLLAVILVLGLVGCDSINTLTEGFQHAKEVEMELESSVGMRPHVGFNWSNGSLTTVTVTFPRIDNKRSLPELADTVREAVAKHFQQTPRDIVLGFSLGRSGSSTGAQRDELRLADCEKRMETAAALFAIGHSLFAPRPFGRAGFLGVFPNLL
jgi:hypothetical protein